MKSTHRPWRVFWKCSPHHWWGVSAFRVVSFPCALLPPRCQACSWDTFLSSYSLTVLRSVHSALWNSVGDRGFLLHFICSATWKEKYELWHFLFVNILMKGQVTVTYLKTGGTETWKTPCYQQRLLSHVVVNAGMCPTAQFGENPILFKPQMGYAMNGSLDKYPFSPSAKPWVCLSCTLVISAIFLFL